MAAVVLESVTSREREAGANPSATLIYKVTGTSDDQVAMIEVSIASPPTYQYLTRLSIRLVPLADSIDTDSGIGMWEATVTYGPQSRGAPVDGNSTFSFSTTGGTSHVTQSKATIGKYAPSGTATDHKGAIGVGKGSVEGCDITVPVYSWSETHYLNDESVTDSYKQTLFNLTGKVNSTTYKNYAAGEVLFLGAEGTLTESQDPLLWAITYHFSASPNRTNIAIGDITVSAKKGWEYLWVEYEEAADLTANRIARRPIGAYVEQVYEYADLNGLGV